MSSNELSNSKRGIRTYAMQSLDWRYLMCDDNADSIWLAEVNFLKDMILMVTSALCALKDMMLMVTSALLRART